MRFDAKCPKSLWPQSLSSDIWQRFLVAAPSRVDVWTFVFLFWALMSLPGVNRAWAQGGGDKSGALPMGELSDIDAGKVAAPAEKKDERPVECTDLVANPLGMPMEYTRDGSQVWWLARIKNTTPGAKSGRSAEDSQDSSDKLRFVLYVLDIKNRTATPRAAIDLLEPIAMLLRKNAVSIVSFQQGGQSRCLEGPGTLFDLSISKKTEGAVQQLGSYGILASPRGRMLFDKTRVGIIETDPQTGQKRLLRKLKDGEKPLFFDPTGKKLLVYVQSKNDKHYVTYSGDKTTETGREKLPGNVKYVYTPNGSKVALEVRGSEGVLKIHELSSWNGAGGKGVYKMTLPKGFSPYDARVDIDPGSGVAVVTGESLATRQTWQKAFVYRYRMGKLLTTLSFDGTQYPNLVALSPKGDTIFVEVRSTLSKTTIGGRIFDLSSGKVKMINITLPPG